MFKAISKACAALVIFSGASSFASDADILQHTMNWIYAEDWASAKAEASKADDPVISEIYDWHALRKGQGTYPEYVAFLEDNAEWPGLGWLQERGEALIPVGEAPGDVVAYIEHMGPQSDEGLVRYLRALKQMGEIQKAEAALMEFALDDEISRESFDKIAMLGLSNFSQTVYAQANTQIYEREYENLSSLRDLMSENELAVIDTRLAVLARETLVPETHSGGVLYDLMRIYKTDDDYDRAAQVMAASSTSKQALERPEYWAEDRLDLARNQLWKNNPQQAYALAANHFLDPEDKGYAGLEFYAGFVALEFLQEEELAHEHFLNFKETVNTPISNGRAGYWLGRSGDLNGYEYGAKWQTSFYGQLSAEKLGKGFDARLIARAPVSDYAFNEFLSSDNIRSALYFYGAGEELLARRFMAHEAETLPAADAESLGLMASDLNMAHTAVHIGKNIANRGEVIFESYYPIPDYIDENALVPDALALGIMRQESEFYPRAESHVGAQGLMQLMPSTAQEVSQELGVVYDLAGLKERPAYNVQLGTKYIRDLLRDFDGTLPVAVLSYNAGPGRGRSWQEHLGAFPRDDEDKAVRWIEMIPFDETRNYVQRVLEGMFIYQAKLQGNFDSLSPQKLLLESYPEGVDWAAIRAEEERIAEEKRRKAEEYERRANSGEIIIPLPLARSNGV